MVLVYHVKILPDEQLILYVILKDVEKTKSWFMFLAGNSPQKKCYNVNLETLNISFLPLTHY